MWTLADKSNDLVQHNVPKDQNLVQLLNRLSLQMENPEGLQRKFFSLKIK